MKRDRQLAVILVLAFGLSGILGGCSAPGPALMIRDYDLSVQPPAARPEVAPVVPRLVRYPGLDISYVANGEGDTYCCRGEFFTFFEGNWFMAKNMQGPWTFIQMKFVPSDCFRVLGQLPPGTGLSKGAPTRGLRVSSRSN